MASILNIPTSHMSCMNVFQIYLSGTCNSFFLTFLGQYIFGGLSKLSLVHSDVMIQGHGHDSIKTNSCFLLSSCACHYVPAVQALCCIVHTNKQNHNVRCDLAIINVININVGCINEALIKFMQGLVSMNVMGKKL